MCSNIEFIMDSPNRATSILRTAFVIVLSASLFVSPLVRMEGEPLGFIKWSVAQCSLVMLVALLAAYWLFARQMRIYSSPIAIPLLALLVFSALSVLWASPRFESITRLRHILLSWGPLFACLLAPLNRRHRMIATGAFVAGVTLVSVLGIAQYLGGLRTIWQELPWEPELGRRAFATMWNPNFLAGLLVLALPVIWAWLRTVANTTGRLLLSAAFCVNFACLLFTNSWGGWVAFAVSLVFWTVSMGIARRRRRRELPARKRRSAPSARRSWDKGAIAVGLICALFAIVFFAAKGQTVAGSSEGLSERDKMYRSTVRLIKEHPLGLGIGNFAVYENKYHHDYLKPSSDLTETWRKDKDSLLHNSFYCHNELLETALELGFVGVALLIWFVICACRPAFDDTWHGREGRADSATIEGIMATAVCTGAVAVFVQSFVSYPLRVPTTVTSLAVLMLSLIHI